MTHLPISHDARQSMLGAYRLCVAPMMDWTDRHCRLFLRQLSPDARLYTEMVTAQAVVRGDRERLLGFHPEEQPVAIQLGGSDPGLLAEAAAIAEAWGYDEVNLNIGCPSERVQEGAFGACLMKEPRLVARCVSMMGRAVRVPVTVKTRIGVDDVDDYPHLAAFVAAVADAGCSVFFVHARKAFLKGLSPRENRTVPPLRYEYVYRLKRDFPSLTVVLNGGVEDDAGVDRHFANGVDGVMIGRRAYHDPYWLAVLQQRLFERTGWLPPHRREVVARMARYVDHEMPPGARLRHVTRHMLGLYHGEPGARSWRRRMGELGTDPAAGAAELQALAVPDDERGARRNPAVGFTPGPGSMESEH